ncbi:MAG: PEP-CTERM sorting domain-containing protein [Planctomycetota bacterium]
MTNCKYFISFAAIGCLAAGFGSPVGAGIVTDQSVNAFTAPSPSGEIGGPSIDDLENTLQTFTVGIGGTLNSIEVQVQQSDGTFPGDLPNEDLTLSILGTTGGVPDFGQNLGSVSLPASSIPAFDGFTSGPFTAYDLSGLGIAVSPGDVLAFQLSSTTTIGSYFIYDSEVDIYGGGTSYVFSPLDGFFADFSPRDLGFITTVAIPEPSSSILLSLGGLLFVRRQRRESAAS